MSRLQKDSTIPSVASTSQEDQESRTLKVTLLSSEWRSSTDGDLSTINRELAIQLAKHPNVDVSILLPNCSGEDRSSAESHNVKLIEADKVPGVEPVLWLSSPPRNHTMDCVIGHGVHLGRLIPFIKKNPNYSCCKWIQVVHSAPEEDGMYKNISEGEKMQKTEIQLCKMADQVITIGPKLAEVYKRYLCPVKQEENVFDLTPSIFSEFLEVKQAIKERRTFFILVIGSGDSCADFNVKGYDIAAKAIAELKDESYKLKFVCAAGVKGDIVADKLLHHGISCNQLIIRSFDDSREVLADLFCEVDLAIMPSRTEGFGIKALEALSAGLPVLVSGNSGLGEALKQVLLGSQSVVDSEYPKDWAREIKRVRQKKREVRLSESSLLREKYLEKYSWEVPCKSLVIKMKKLIFGGNEQVIRNLQQWQQNASRYKNSSNTDPLSDLEKIASEKGYKISDNQGLGNCMFYALSEQLETVKGVKIHHFELRRSLVQYLREHPKQVDGTDLFHFVDRHTTWGDYLTDMEQDGTWGDHVILWAAANCYQIAIHVISSLPGHSEVIIKPDCPFDQSKHLVLGHVHEVHYVSLQPLQEIRVTIPGRDKRPAPVSTDQPHKQLRKELTNHDYCEGQNRHLSTEHDQYKVSGGSSTCYTGLVQQRSHPQGSSSYGLPAPVAVDYSQGNLHAPLVNLNFEGQKRHPSTEHDQNSFAGASSTYYRGLVHQRGHPHGSLSFDSPAPVAVDYSQGNLPAAFVNPNCQGSQTFPQNIARNEDSIHQGSHTQSSFSHGLSPQFVQQNQCLTPATTSTQLELTYQRGNHLAVVCQLLKNEYNRRSQLKPLFWNNTIQLPLEDVYTRLKILHRRKRDFQLGNTEVNTSEIFKNGDDVIVLVEGSPGMGKTTFCLKIAHDWANKATLQVDSFPQFEVVLLLKCRDIHGDIIEAIDTQLLPEIKNAEAIKTELIDYIEDFHYDKKALIILDGLDELPEKSESCVDRLLHKKIFPFCHILATSRQERGIVVRKTVNFDMLLQIEGFTREDAFNYIRKHFKNAGLENVSNGERLIKEIQTNSFLDALWNNPLNLLLLCIVFEDHEGELPSHRTELYQIIVCCLLRRYCAKHNLEAPAGDEALMRHFEDSFLVLGELAWRCLKEDRFSFREEELGEFESRHESLAARTLGLVFKEASLRKINPQHEYFFFHKTFQEYLAAFYLAQMLLKQMVDFSELNFYRDLVESYRQVFVFMSGILGEEAGLLFKQIGKKLKDQNWDWCKYYGEEATFFHECFSESRNYEEVAKALFSFIPFPQTITIDLANEETIIDYFIILNACKDFLELFLPVHLEIVNTMVSYMIIPEDGQLLDDFLSYCTRLQTLSFSIWDMKDEIIITLLCKVLRVVSTAYSFTLESNCSFSSDEVVAISDSLAANKSLTSVTFKVPCGMLKDYVTILDKGLSADTPLTSVVFKIFGSWTETEAELLRKILLNRSLTSLSLTVVEDMCDSLATSVSKGLVANPSLKSLALIVWGKLSYTDLSLLKEGFLGNNSLECLQLKVFGELPTNWVNICGTLQSTMKSTTSFTVYPNVTGMVGNSQVAFLCPFLKENLLALKLNSLTVNIWGELDCSGATDLCKLVRASSVSCVNLNLNGIITDSIADCLFKHFDKLNTLSNLSIHIRGEVMGDGKNSLQRLSCNQVYLFALNVHSSNSSNKICRDVYLTADDSSSLIPVFTKVKDSCVTKLSVNINNPGSIREDWKCNLFEGVAKNECLTTLNLEFNNIYSFTIENMDALWDAVEENATLTTVNLTVNNCCDTGGDQICILGNGLLRNTSLTTLSLTVNNYSHMEGYLTDILGDGLGENTSLTMLSLTVNNYSHMEGYLIGHLGDGLGKNTSLTTLSLTVNNDSHMEVDLTDILGDGLGKNTSLTTLSLTVNNYSYVEGDFMGHLGDGSWKNTSLTTLSFTVNNYSHMEGDLTLGLGDVLGKNTSLTTLSLTVNNYSHMEGDLTLGLGDGLGKNTSLTTLSLTVNNYSHMEGDFIGHLGDGLGKNTSLTTLSLTVNNYSHMEGDLTDILGDGLGENTSLTTLSLTVNNYSYMEGYFIGHLGDGLGKNTSLTTLSLTVNNYSEIRGEWRHILADGLTKNTSVVTLNLTLSNLNNLYEDWIHGLVDALVTNMSSTAISLEVNIFGEGNKNCESILA
ncbi:uncharacterized protein [Pocillopora verrucosa]|uniref:uncharacterized protein isoform X4 n=1 Tax=Pocillopora verrucosa TaxID=203993 RepID=UPI0033427F71